MTDPHLTQALIVLFDLAQADRRATPKLLAEQLAIRADEATHLLRVLDACDLVDGARVRLTMQGLALAARAKTTGQRLRVAA